jgi:hypothetical protein
MKYIIIWNAGLGEENKVVDADSLAEANTEAYECWSAAAEKEAEYDALEYSDDLAEELGIDG